MIARRTRNPTNAMRITEPRLRLVGRYLSLRPRYRMRSFRIPRTRAGSFISRGFLRNFPPAGLERVSVLDELQLKRERENQEAERHRRRRDELNDKTREWVEKRDALNAQVRTLVDEATQHRIQREELNDARDLAEDAHRRVSELAEKAQAEHDQMTALYEQGDNLRREADRAQEEFIKTKMLADEEHRKHIEHIRQVHDYDKIIHGIWMKSRGVTEEVAEEVDAKKEAELIFERFKKGEKLSTEDLLMLQKSGYL